MGGSYQTARFLGILSASEGTTFRPYMAFEYYHNDGPFKNPSEYNRYNFFSNFTLLSNARSTWTFWPAISQPTGTPPARFHHGRYGTGHWDLLALLILAKEEIPKGKT